MGTTPNVQDTLDTWMEEEEEEEEEEALKCRKPRGTAAAGTQSIVVPREDEAKEEEVPPPVVAEIHSGQLAALESEKSIYFDTNDGTKSTNGTGGVSYGVLGDSLSDKKLGNGDSDFTQNGDPKTITIETNHQSHTNLKEETPSRLHLLHSENGTATHSPVEDPHLRLLKGSKQEVAEWDVERVLDEQETHELYCPNCNSCITKRVILRKRKRRIPNLQYDSKREKIEPVQSPSLATDNQGDNSTLPGLDGSPPSVDASDQDNVTEPDLFRCLSCFSFFIPSVASFKSFRFFGQRGERERAQNLQQIPVRTGAVKQGGEDAMQLVEEVANEYPPSNRSEIFSVIPRSNDILDQPLRDTALEPKEERKDFPVSSTTSAMLEIVQNSAAEKSYGAVIKNKQEGEDAMPHIEEVADEYPTAHQNDPVSSLVPVFNNVLVQPVNDAALEPKEDRRDVQVSSTTSVMLEIVNNGVQETPYDAVTSIRQDEKDEHNGQVSSMSVSVHLVQTRTDTGDKHQDASKRIEGGYDVMQDQSGDELLDPLPYLGQNVLLENSESILSRPVPQLPGTSNTGLEGGPKLIPFKEGKYTAIMSKAEALLPQDIHIGVPRGSEDPQMSSSAGKDVILRIGAEQVSPEDSSRPGVLTYRETEYENGRQVGESIKLDILKSMVYGGLVECVGSLGVVSSAAGGDATTLNILALGLANLVGGLFIIAHGLMDLKDELYRRGTNVTGNTDRYQELLGMRTNFRLHATVAVLSYLVFGLVPPVAYGFSFRASDNKTYKLIVVAAVSLVCISLLAIAKSYVRRPPKDYIKTVLYFLSIGVMSSGLSYVMGTLINTQLEKLGWFEQTSSSSPAFLVPMAVESSWASF